MTKKSKTNISEDEVVAKPDEKQGSTATVRATIKLDAQITIKEIARTYETLSGYMVDSSDVTLEADGVTEVDTAGLQLLLAFSKEMVAQNRDLVWGSASVELLQMAELLGLTQELGLQASGTTQV